MSTVKLMLGYFGPTSSVLCGHRDMVRDMLRRQSGMSMGMEAEHVVSGARLILVGGESGDACTQGKGKKGELTRCVREAHCRTDVKTG